MTTPALVTEATAVLSDTQVPPVDGVKFLVLPIHTLGAPVIATTGSALIVTGLVGDDIQPVDVCVHVNVAVPAERPVTLPVLSTAATAPFDA